MRLWIALTYLDRKEWTRGTVFAAMRGLFELGLRKCLRDDGDDRIAAHVALFFEGATEKMKQLNAEHCLKWKDYGSFTVDILQNNGHIVSSLDDTESWYRSWESGSKIEFYEVLDVTESQIEHAHEAVMSFVSDREPYDCFRNLNAIFPWFPIPCRLVCWPCCCACPCFVWKGGVTCVSATLVGLAAARGVDDGAPRGAVYDALQIPARAVLGGRLPSEMVKDLIDAGQVDRTPTTLLFAQTEESSLPLLAMPV